MKYLATILFFLASYSIQSNEPHKKLYYEWNPDQFHKEKIIQADSIELITKGRINLWNNGNIIANVDSNCLNKIKS